MKEMGELEELRLNKFLAQAGVCSRREADRLIAEGAVTVDGKPVVAGQKVTKDAVVNVHGKPVRLVEEEVLLVFNKPKGLVCTAASEQSPDNVIDYIQYHTRVYNIGRLDKDSEGLLLLTNQGELAYRLEKPNFEHEKEYVVETKRPFDDLFLKKMASGVYLEELDVTTLPCVVERVNERTFRIILKQGYNRQIRRMCDAYGHAVEKLTRVRIANILIGNLPIGKYRQATAAEVEGLKASLGL